MSQQNALFSKVFYGKQQKVPRTPPVDACLSCRLSLGHPAGVPGISLKFIHWEIKGRFRKRVVLANVPSFRFSFRGNIRRNHPFGNHPFVNTKKGHWEIKGRFLKGWFWRTCPRSGFRSGGTSAETTLLRTPDLCALFFPYKSHVRSLASEDLQRSLHPERPHCDLLA